MNSSHTIFTSPIQSPTSNHSQNHSLFLSNATNLKKNLQSLKRPDYQSALDFADFIGLSPPSKAKKRQLSNIEKFFQTNNFKPQNYETQNNGTPSKQIIKNDIQNRKLNFFDLKRIFKQRTNSLKLHKSKQIFHQKQSLLSNQIQLKYSRILSAKTGREPNRPKKYFSDVDDQYEDIDETLRVQTARELNRKKKEKAVKNQENAYFLKVLHNDKVNRSKILKIISRNTIRNELSQTQANPELSDLKNLQKANQIVINKNKKSLVDGGETAVESVAESGRKQFHSTKNQSALNQSEKEPKKHLNQIHTPRKLIDFSAHFDNSAYLNSAKNDKIVKSRPKNKTLDLRFQKQTNRFEYSFKPQKK